MKNIWPLIIVIIISCEKTEPDKNNIEDIVENCTYPSKYFCINSQNAIWKYEEEVAFSGVAWIYSYNYEIIKDTIVNSEVLKKIIEYEIKCHYWDVGPPDLKPGCVTTFLRYIFIKIDTCSGKIYHCNIDNNTCSLIYDFNLEVGDTIPVSALTYNYHYTIEQIHIASAFGKKVRRYKVVCVDIPDRSFYIYEGIGSNHGLIDPAKYELYYFKYNDKSFWKDYFDFLLN